MRNAKVRLLHWELAVKKPPVTTTRVTCDSQDTAVFTHIAGPENLALRFVVRSCKAFHEANQHPLRRDKALGTQAWHKYMKMSTLASSSNDTANLTSAIFSLSPLFFIFFHMLCFIIFVYATRYHFSNILYRAHVLSSQRSSWRSYKLPCPTLDCGVQVAQPRFRAPQGRAPDL